MVKTPTLTIHDSTELYMELDFNFLRQKYFWFSFAIFSFKLLSRGRSIFNSSFVCCLFKILSDEKESKYERMI